MANLKHVEILAKGIDFWNKWRQSNKGTRPDLSDLDISSLCSKFKSLAGFDFSATNFSKSNLSGLHFGKYSENITAQQRPARPGPATFPGDEIIHVQAANLSGAIFILSNVSNTNLSYCNLEQASFGGTNLKNSILDYANISRTEFRMCDLTKTSLKCITASSVNFSDINMERAQFIHSFFQNSIFYKVKFFNTALASTEFQNNYFENVSFINTEFQIKDVMSFGPVKSYRIMMNNSFLSVVFESVNLCEYNIKNSSFKETVFKNCSLQSTDISSSTLIAVEFINSNIQDIKFKNFKTCQYVRCNNCYGSRNFIRHVSSESIISEIKQQNYLFYFLWKILSDCGRSFNRLLLFVLLIILR